MPVANITSLPPVDLGKNIGAARIGRPDDGFGSLIKDAVESIDNTQKGAEQEVAKAVSGETTDLHRTIIALQTADLKFQLGLQVRNKVIGAFDEIMKMPV